MLRSVARAVLRFLQHPLTGIAIGLVVAASGVDDLIDAIRAGNTGFGVHHGMIVFGSYKTLAALADALDGMGTVADKID
jgi:hypothetical protein